MTAEVKQVTFTKRNCPACYGGDSSPLFSVSPSQFYGFDFDYASQMQSRIGIEPGEQFKVVRCASCSFVFTELAPSQEFLSLLYDDMSASTTQRHESLNPAWVSHQLKLTATLLESIGQVFGSKTRPNILDFGCGFGAIVRALNGPTASCMGYETSSVMVRHLQAESLPVVSNLANAPAPFHAIIMSDVLEHLTEPRLVLRELCGLLVPDGLLCVSVPDFNEKRIQAIQQSLSKGVLLSREINPWEHLNYFSPTSLRDMLKAEGFSVVPSTSNLGVGLRPGLNGLTRWGNLVKSIGRSIHYALTQQESTTSVLAQKR